MVSLIRVVQLDPADRIHHGHLGPVDDLGSFFFFISLHAHVAHTCGVIGVSYGFLINNCMNYEIEKFLHILLRAIV